MNKYGTEWRHVSSAKSLSDVGSRGWYADKPSKLQLKGFEWLTYPVHWLTNIFTALYEESQQEAKQLKEALATAVNIEDMMDETLSKYDLWKILHIAAWFLQLKKYLQKCETKQSCRASNNG